MWRSTIIVLVLMLGLQLGTTVIIQQQEPNDPSNDMEEEIQDWEGLEDTYKMETENPSRHEENTMEESTERDLDIPPQNKEKQEVQEEEEIGYKESRIDLPKNQAKQNVTSSVHQCLLRRDYSISTRTYADNIIVGGKGGSILKINSRGYKGNRISRIRVWAQKHTIRGIEIDYIGCTSFYPRRYMCGKRYGYSRTFHFGYGERITKLKIWGNNRCGYRGRVNRVEFRTNRGRWYGNGRKVGYPYIPHIGSGILGGMILRCGSDVDALAFLLFK